MLRGGRRRLQRVRRPPKNLQRTTYLHASAHMARAEAVPVAAKPETGWLAVFAKHNSSPRDLHAAPAASSTLPRLRHEVLHDNKLSKAKRGGGFKRTIQQARSTAANLGSCNSSPADLLSEPAASTRHTLPRVRHDQVLHHNKPSKANGGGGFTQQARSTPANLGSCSTLIIIGFFIFQWLHLSNQVRAVLLATLIGFACFLRLNVLCGKVL